MSKRYHCHEMSEIYDFIFRSESTCFWLPVHDQRVHINLQLSPWCADLQIDLLPNDKDRGWGGVLASWSTQGPISR